MPTWVAVNLILRNDDLAGVGVIGVLNGVAQDADHTDHLTRLANAVRDVAGVADELLTASHLQHGWERMSTSLVGKQTVTSLYQIAVMHYLALRLYSDHVAAFHHYLIHRLVQHVGASIDRAQPKTMSERQLLNLKVNLFLCIQHESEAEDTWRIPAAALPAHTGGRGRGSSHTGPEIHCTAWYDWSSPNREHQDSWRRKQQK